MRSAALTIAALAAAGLASSGCADDDLALPPPPAWDEMGAIVFVIETAGGDVEAVAAAGDQPRLLSLDFRRGTTARIYALQYRETLAELDLAAGPLEVGLTKCGARPLPEQAQLHVVEIEGEVAPTWSTVERRPGAVDDVRIDGRCPCITFDIERAVTSPDVDAYFEGDGETTLLDDNGAFWTLDAEGRIEAVDTTTIAPQGDLLTVTQDESGRLWLMVDDTLWRGTPQGGFEPHAMFAIDSIVALAASRGGPPEEVYALSLAGRVLRMAPGAPEILAEPLPARPNGDQRGRLLWLGPGRLVAAQAGATAIFWLTDGVVTERSEVPIESGGAWAMKDVPEVGLVVLGRDTRVVEFRDFAPRLRYDAPELASGRSLIAYPGGYLYTGDGGYVQQYIEGFGFCPTQFLDGRPRGIALFEMSGRLWMYGIAAGVGPQFYLLAPRPLRPEALPED